ncbi:MAG: hypothetical protein KDC38_17595 [Planctomycetes bacterium]|nr:hypothetical protein [Planctomycetota bacterium]
MTPFTDTMKPEDRRSEIRLPEAPRSGLQLRVAVDLPRPARIARGERFAEAFELDRPIVRRR